MSFVKNVAVSLREFVCTEAAKLLKIAINTLTAGPAFYLIIWLSSHHAPSHDMWLGFFLGALLFTSVNRKANSRPNKEEPQRPSTPIIILPSSR